MHALHIVSFGIVLIAKFTQSLDDLSSSTDCLTVYHACIENAAEIQRKILNGPSDKQLEDSLAECFDQNGCNKPEADSQGHVNEVKRNEKAKIAKCQNETIMSRLPAIEKCVQQDFNNFKLKQPLKIANGSKTDPLVGRKHYLEQIKQKCDKANVETAKECVASTFFNASASQKGKKERQKMKDFCEARQTCLAKLNTECKTRLDQLKETVCRCEKMQDNRPIENQYQSCVNSGNDTPVDGSRQTGRLSHVQMKQINTAFCFTDENACEQPKQKKPGKTERDKQKNIRDQKRPTPSISNRPQRNRQASRNSDNAGGRGTSRK